MSPTPVQKWWNGHTSKIGIFHQNVVWFFWVASLLSRVLEFSIKCLIFTWSRKRYLFTYINVTLRYHEVPKCYLIKQLLTNLYHPKWQTFNFQASQQHSANQCSVRPLNQGKTWEFMTTVFRLVVKLGFTCLSNRLPPLHLPTPWCFIMHSLSHRGACC